MDKEKNNPRVLIVDDEVQIRFYLNTLVKSLGFEPVLAKNGVQGLDILTNIRPNAIVLDIMMPEKGGVVFYRDLMDKKIDIPIIFFSGVDKKAFFHHMKMLNANLKTPLKDPEYYVAKQADPEYLKSIIKTCVMGNLSGK